MRNRSTPGPTTKPVRFAPSSRWLLVLITATWISSAWAVPVESAQQTSQAEDIVTHRSDYARLVAEKTITHEELQTWLKRYPEADSNRDGTLTIEEARAYGKRSKAGAGKPKGDKARWGLAPNRVDVSYGPHPSNRFDFWKAKDASKPAPLIVFIHGGGFVGGDKSRVDGALVKEALGKGAAFLSVNYRFLKEAPIQDILRDCARAIQFVRANATEFGIDPDRVAAFGSSAGAGASLWLATRADLADPQATDPVLRQSSRLRAAGIFNGAATFNLVEWEQVVYPFKPEWRTSPEEGPAFYHFRTEGDYATPLGQKVLADCSMLSQLSSDDPPVFLYYSQPDGEPKSRGHLLHHPKHMQLVAASCRELGIPVKTIYAPKGGSLGDNDVEGATAGGAAAVIEFLWTYLNATS